jgi:hypothetical protein
MIPAFTLLTLAWYFWTNIGGPDPSRDPFRLRGEVLAQRERDLVSAKAEQATWQRRVEALRGPVLDRDLLDERVRAMLNWSAPNDQIFFYPPGGRLF